MTRRILFLIGLILGGAGVVLLIVAAVLTVNSISFRSSAVSAQGTVVEIEEDRDCDDGRCRMMYTPIVEFATPDGQQHTVPPTWSTSHPPDVDSTLPVLYQESEPDQARIDNFIGFWFPSVLTGGIGLLLAGIGIPIFLTQLRKRRVDAWLETSGQRLTATITDVSMNRNVRINRRHPWVVWAVANDPANGQELRFVSENLMVDPREMLRGATTVEVLVDPQAPGKRYRMNLAPYGIGA